ncbi:Protein kinase C-binding protein NELL2 [Hypsibius exemplaris]|uniref:Protein kinase C-binding protein NELL2 n=1 Tax=Hypsibius exemplaris TaxID=2072580 RepID=A0A1W0X4G2_HYPEX|nr:Protein kinase C-binding protein NELL2 [Hypsibius exemplaris]
MLSRNCHRHKEFDVVSCLCGWSGVLLTLFATLNLTAAQDLQVIDRNSDRQYPPPELDLLPFIVNSNDSPAGAAGMATVRPSRALGPFAFVDDHRQVEVTRAGLEIVQDMLRKSAGELTFLATVKQHRDNNGTLIALAVDTTRVLELASYGRADEVIIKYRNGSEPVAVKKIHFPLADNEWHNMAVTLYPSGEVVFRLDCREVHRAPISPMMIELLRQRPLSLWMGQRHPNMIRSRDLKGALKLAKVTTAADAYMEYCHRSSPATLSALVAPIRRSSEVQMKSFDALANTALAVRLDDDIMAKVKLYLDSERRKEIEILTNKFEIRIKALEDQVEYIQQERHIGFCKGLNGSLHREDDIWEEDCSICRCRGDTRDCQPMICNASSPSCSSGQNANGFCCPACQSRCQFMGAVYSSNETLFATGRTGACLKCSCINGQNNCAIQSQVTCPALLCPEWEQVEQPGTCCRKCQEKNRTCANQTCGFGGDCQRVSNTSNDVACKCLPGFTGNGTHCMDNNECLNPASHKCDSNQICINIPGSYRCECQAGFTGSRKAHPSLMCRDINECQTRSDRCHVNAKCSNTQGSYNCQCLPGYDGDGFNCTPRCDPECQNGGQCFAPNTCACKGGYFGPECNVDVDECAFNISRCEAHSVCVNIPGSFFCKCLDGFATVNASSQQPVCLDVDECSTGEHKCPPLSRCQNFINGSYGCVCVDGEESCDLSCSREKSIYFAKLLPNQCETCECKLGVWTCKAPSCDCQSDTDRATLEKCCPQCNTKTAPVCTDPETGQRYPSGFAWFEDCENCECMMGEIRCRPLTCPPAPCNNSILPPDHCCPVCPMEIRHTEEPVDGCFNSTHRKAIAPIKFGCETQKPGSGAFFNDWSPHIDICELCDCTENGICCVVKNDCLLHNQLNHRPLSSARGRF